MELVRVGQPESLLLNCSIQSSGDLQVSGDSYLGGFVGALANSYTVNCTIEMPQENGTLLVEGSGSNVGGWAGIGTVGWATNLGGSLDDSVLAEVSGVLTEILQGDNSGQLLSLVGVAPSATMGCRINGGTGAAAVRADGDYAGGFVGRGDGLYLTSSTEQNLSSLSYWRQNAENRLNIPEARKNQIENLGSVTADSYAGGVAGSLRTASIAGLLNNVAGVGSYLPFTVEGTNVTYRGGTQTVQAEQNYAGGAFGELVGGTVTDVTVTGLKLVQADNLTAGFAAVCGPGELVGTGGIDLDLLG